MAVTIQKRHREFLRLLEREGIPATLDFSGRHPRVIIRHGEVSRFYVIPASPSDRCSNRNALSDIRRIYADLTRTTP